MRRVEEKFPEEFRDEAETMIALSQIAYGETLAGLTLDQHLMVATIRRWQYLRDMEALHGQRG